MDPGFIGPLSFHARGGLVLPLQNSLLQHKLSDMMNFTKENMMMVNKKKTKAMPCNFTQNWDFIPQLSFPGEEPLEVIYVTKLLGVHLTSDLNFETHVQHIKKKVMKNMWLLIRFRDMGASRTQLLTLWQHKGRSVLEFASPVFFSSLTQKQSRLLEHCQIIAFTIILNGSYRSYSHALLELKQERFDTRRMAAALKWGKKCVTNPRHSDMFPLYQQNRTNMRKRDIKYDEYFCRSQRMYDSTLPTICRMLNDENRVTH